MPVTVAEAKKLLTVSELELFRKSGQREIKELTPAQLKAKIQRARRLRDKSKDKAQQQRGEARGKRAPKGTRPSGDNERSVRKTEILGLALERFEARLAKMEEEKRHAEEKKLREAEKKQKAAEKKRLAAERKKKVEAKKRLQAARPKKVGAGRAAAKDGTAASAPGTGVPGRASRDSARVRATRGHNRAAGRRAQTRKDKRS
jgi:hypothetical protein